MLNVLYILETPRHNYMPRLLPGWTRKDIEQVPNFFRLRVEILNVLYILEVLRHNYMPGLLPGWTRKDIEQLPSFSFQLPVEMLNVLYILEALRHNFIAGYLRLSLRCARWDKCNFMCRHLPDLEADISSSRLRHWLCRRMSALFCFYESWIKESLSENREITIVILLQTTN